MPRTTLILGAILIGVGVVSYIAAGFSSWTALIPAILGLLVAACGLIAVKNQKIGIHIALLVALLGIAGTFMNVINISDLFTGQAERPIAIIASVVTFLLLIVYVVMGVRSFIAARRWKNSEAVTE
ncbi:hypothetical protein [Kocuria sp. 2SI]|uniref:hypothetical protein n=1 Tax=Kocuria sp. 2SI TaxID=2502203 RepID=UPI0010F436E2|nr:hypothetical protein [Kocuria sp. 2SI]